MLMRCCCAWLFPAWKQMCVQSSKAARGWQWGPFRASAQTLQFWFWAVGSLYLLRPFDAPTQK